MYERVMGEIAVVYAWYGIVSAGWRGYAVCSIHKNRDRDRDKVV